MVWPAKGMPVRHKLRSQQACLGPASSRSPCTLTPSTARRHKLIIAKIPCRAQGCATLSLMTFSRPPHARARPASHGGCQEPVALPQHSLPLSAPPQLQQLAGSLPPWHNRVVLGQGEGGRAARALPGPLVRHALDLRRWGGWWGRRWGGGTHKHGRGDMAMWATT